jgi:hypothetical protein
MVNKGGDVAVDGFKGKSVKRKANAVENRGISLVQITGALQKRAVATGISPPPGFIPTPRSYARSLSYDKEEAHKLGAGLNPGGGGILGAPTLS